MIFKIWIHTQKIILKKSEWSYQKSLLRKNDLIKNHFWEKMIWSKITFEKKWSDQKSLLRKNDLVKNHFNSKRFSFKIIFVQNDFEQNHFSQKWFSVQKYFLVQNDFQFKNIF
jgi:hypothetical protein